MVKKRIIFSLIYSDGFFTQSRNFRLQRVGNIKWLEKNYQFQKIAFSLDELILINATRGDKNVPKFCESLKDIVRNVFIPICAGGGIRNINDAELLFKSGADKILVNTALYHNHSLVGDIIRNYGAQSVVASVDYKIVNGERQVYVADGTEKIPVSLLTYIDYLQELNVGEIYLNSIDKDGTGFGYDFETIKLVAKKIRNPLIIAGGAGNENHLTEGLQIEEVNAVATANLFNFIGDGIPIARRHIIEAGINIVNWETTNFNI